MKLVNAVGLALEFMAFWLMTPQLIGSKGLRTLAGGAAIGIRRLVVENEESIIEAWQEHCGQR